MYAVTRSYAGEAGKKLAARLEERKTEIEKVLRGVDGFITWALMQTSDGIVTYTLCQDKKGCDQSVNVAREWIQKNAADISVPAPTIAEGPIKMRFTA